jgi:hypothetical protein
MKLNKQENQHTINCLHVSSNEVENKDQSNKRVIKEQNSNNSNDETVDAEFNDKGNVLFLKTK